MAEGSGGFWSSLPGVLTGVAAILTAMGGIYALTRDDRASVEAEATVPSPAPAQVENLAQPIPKTSSPVRPVEEASPASAPESKVMVETGRADACKSGYVWREARPGDHVCVTPATRDETAAENEAAESRRSPAGGEFGPNTCLSGFVWREAYYGDPVCVEPGSRDRAHADNKAGLQRRADN